MARCERCNENVWKTTYGKETGWKSLCEDCYPMAAVNGTWTEEELIKSRVRMPDGTVIQGAQGQRILDTRLRHQAELVRSGKLQMNTPAHG